jgi:hypothetical protein
LPDSNFLLQQFRVRFVAWQSLSRDDFACKVDIRTQQQSFSTQAFTSVTVLISRVVTAITRRRKKSDCDDESQGIT